MPRLSVWFIRTALLHFLLGFTFGMLLLMNKGVLISPLLWRLLPLHIEMLFVGWTIQLAMGVAFWILPRLIFGPPRGNERLLWIVYALLNSGVLLAGLGQILNWPTSIVLAGRVCEALAVFGFVSQAWLRVKALGK
jgi:hypothetical protein